MGILCSELRFGNNLLLYGKVVKVTEIGFRIDDYYLRVEGNKNGYYLDQFEPIELTEEMLLKCGFENFEGRFTHEDCDFILECEDNYWEEPSIDVIFEGKYLTCVEKLHQLQNLFYCLVGEELNVKL